MSRSVSLIDAQFLEAARHGTVPDERWDLQTLADWLVPRHHWRFRTYYFDAPPYLPRQPTDEEQARFDAKRSQLARVNRLERFSVREGYCKLERKTGRSLRKQTRGEYHPIQFVGQKMVDVLLATELTRIAWSREALHIGLVAGDADFRPAVQAAQQAGAIVRLFHIKKPAGGKRPGTGASERLLDLVDERVDLAPIFEAMAQGVPPPSKPSHALDFRMEPEIRSVQAKVQGDVLRP